MKQIDARKKACPLPVVMAKDAMETEEQVQVLVDNFIAVQNIEKMARVKGYLCSHEAQGEDYAVILSKSQELPKPESKPLASCSCTSDYVVVINKEGLGQGDPLLSRKLLSAFFFALTKQDLLPSVAPHHSHCACHSHPSFPGLSPEYSHTMGPPPCWCAKTPGKILQICGPFPIFQIGYLFCSRMAV